MFKFGTLVLVPFPFTDLTSTKLRPALIISKKPQEDVIVSFITSKIPKPRHSAHFLLQNSDRHFPGTGLKTNSVFRFDKIATLSRRLILGELGAVPPGLLKKMKKSFQAAFGF